MLRHSFTCISGLINCHDFVIAWPRRGFRVNELRGHGGCDLIFRRKPEMLVIPAVDAVVTQIVVFVSSPNQRGSDTLFLSSLIFLLLSLAFPSVLTTIPVTV
jgi:hypothetical protein